MRYIVPPAGQYPSPQPQGAATGPFPAKASPTKSNACTQWDRLQLVLLKARRVLNGIGFSREALNLLLLVIFIRKNPKHRQSRLGCRLNAGLAQWAERHGCRESRPPPWMADGGGPTEQDRSEGTRRSRAQPGAQALGYLGLYQVTRRRRNPRPLGRRPGS